MLPLFEQECFVRLLKMQETRAMVRAGVKIFPHSRAHIHFLTSKLYHFLIPLFAGDSGRETITLVHVMNFFISCKISQRVLERQKKAARKIPKVHPTVK